MDPTEVCGRGTTVTRLFKVEEQLDQIRIHHLVFFDRHGWYCEHTRTSHPFFSPAEFKPRRGAATLIDGEKGEK